MNSGPQRERDELLRLIGARDERILQLQLQLAKVREQSELPAAQWRRLQRHRDELAEWLVDGATNESGDLIRTQIDAALGGESFVPCSFSLSQRERRYQFNLVSTVYEILEVAANG